MVKRFRRAVIFTLILAIFLILVIFPVGFAYFYIDGLVNAPCGNRAEPMSSRLSHPEGLQALTFSPENGLTLDAWYAPGTNGAGIVILPGAYGGADTMYQEMEFLHEAGYSVMTYDTRSCANPPRQTSLGYTEIKDLKAAIDIFSQYPEVEKIGVLGYSMGGATVIMTAAEDERILAVVASGNYADLAEEVRRENDGIKRAWWERYARGWIIRMYAWQTGVEMEQASPISVIGEISPRAVYLIHGTEELASSYGDQQFAAAHDPKQFWLVEGARHGQYAAIDFEKYSTSIIEFFNTYLIQQSQ